MNINTSSYWSASSATSNGLSGLVSGMDTESMVEQLLSGTQSKIDAAKGEQQITTWKQEMYRDVITAINDFKNKYFNSSFDASSVNNFASSGFFNDMTASLISGSGLKVVSADSSALTGEMKVKIEQLASAAKVTTANQAISKHTVTGDAIDLKNEITFSIKDEESEQIQDITVDLSELQPNADGEITQQSIVDKLNEKLKDSGVTAKLNAEETGIVLEVADGKTVEGIDASTIAGKLTGLSSYSSSTEGETTTITAGAVIDLNPSLTFDVNFDGITKTIVLDDLVGQGKLDADALSTAINEELGKAFGKYNGESVITTKVVDGALQFGFATGYNTSGHSFKLTGVDLNELGIVPGSSSHVSSSTKLGDLTNASGSVYEFTINGETFKFTSDQTVGDMMNAINASGAGVKISYSSLADQFVLESSSTGANYNITMSQQTGNLLGAMFGNDIVAAADKAQTDVLLTNEIAGSKITLADDNKIKEATIKFKVDGTEYTFSLPQKSEDGEGYTVDEFSDEFNAFLKQNFDGGITYDAESGSLQISQELNVEIVEESVAGTGTGDAAKIELGLAGKNNLATADSVLSNILNLSEQDKNALGTAQTKLSELANENITFENGQLVFTSSSSVKLDGMEFGNGAAFNTSSVGEEDPLSAYVTKGTDAIVNINGVDTTRSSNTFTIDGVTMELTGITGDEPAVIGTERDIDTIVEAFENFVKDYNALLDKLYGYTDQEAEYRDYPPLTSAQKEEMTENEIELWEEKAKTGLLRNDDSITNFLSQMRTAMYERPEGCAFALYDIGIETGEYTEKGKLNIDTAQLRNALASDPGSVEQLFLDMEEGLAGKLEDAMKAAANPSSGSPGVLVELAGIKGYASESNNSLTQELTELKERIEELQARYEDEKQRYWDQFNTMEQILANFNSQSSMISSQFSGY